MHKSTDWLRVVRDAGFPATSVLGSGVEGVALATSADEVVKVWFDRSRRELEQLKMFYDALASAGFGLRFPQVLDVFALHDAWATTQPLLEGRPLWVDQNTSPSLEPADIDAVIAVLAALAATPATAELTSLPVLPGGPAFNLSTPFEHHLANLVEGRVRAHPGHLSVAIPHLDALVEGTTARLRREPLASPTVLHGDLVPSNILISRTNTPAVLDFGFFSTVGDPAFDAAVTTSIYDMYGPSATSIERRLEAAVCDHFGYQPDRLHLYRAAYALTTAHCFSATGSDGHFAWCARMLNRPEVIAASGQ